MQSTFHLETHRRSPLISSKPVQRRELLPKSSSALSATNQDHDILTSLQHYSIIFHPSPDLLNSSQPELPRCPTSHPDSPGTSLHWPLVHLPSPAAWHCARPFAPLEIFVRAEFETDRSISGAATNQSRSFGADRHLSEKVNNSTFDRCLWNLLIISAQATTATET